MGLFLPPIISGPEAGEWMPVFADGPERATICAAVLLAIQYGLVTPGGKL